MRTKVGFVMAGLVLILVVGQVSATIVKTINNCTSIDTPGYYTLNHTIIGSDAFQCIKITSNDVILDGNGYVIDGNGVGYGIYVLSSNVTVRNIVVTNWSFGILFEGDYYYPIGDNVIENITASNNTAAGVILYHNINTTITKSTLSNNSRGIVLASSGFINISDNIISSNWDGILIVFSTRNTINDNLIVGNRNGIRAVASFTFNSNNIVYNNIFNNTVFNGYIGPSDFLNISKTPGKNIVGGPYIGGNAWLKPDCTGFSQTCDDNNGDGICDAPYINEAGNIDYLPLKYPQSCADTTPPTTSLTLSGTIGLIGWYISNAVVTLNATDNEDGSGVARTEYSFDGTNWNTYTTPFIITSEGITTLYYRSIDNAGNIEMAKRQVIKIDKTPPATEIFLNGTFSNSGWYTSNVTVTFIAEDATSGVAATYYSLDGGNYQEGTSFTVTTEGEHTVSYYSVDNAGNKEAQKSASFSIYRTPLEIPATVDIDPDTLNLKEKEGHNEKECKHERDDEKCENGDHREVHEGKWITAYIELPEGYDVNDINVSTVRLNDTIAAEQHPAEVGDHDEDGIPDLMVKFDRRAVIYIISGNATGEVELTVTGNLYSGISFRGSDTIRVIKKEEKLKDKNEKQECKHESSDEEGTKDQKCKHGDEKHREGSDKEKERQHEE